MKFNSNVTKLLTKYSILLFLLVAFCQVNAAKGLGEVQVIAKYPNAVVFADGAKKATIDKSHSVFLMLPAGRHFIRVVAPMLDDGTVLEDSAMIEVKKGKRQKLNMKLVDPSIAARKEFEKNPKAFVEKQLGMVTLDPGCFLMGRNSGETGFEHEDPQHQVCLQGFELASVATTFTLWDLCIETGGCNHIPDDMGWGRNQRPVINVSFLDTKAFIKWLNKVTADNYRLPSEAEWEYAYRAGTTTPFYTGDCIDTRYANFDGTVEYENCGVETRPAINKTMPVGLYDSNPWGLYDMAGNVWEWVEDCKHDNYHGAPSDGSVWRGGDCMKHMVRCGSWFTGPQGVRAANRGWSATFMRNNATGFRLAR
jgi:formylglycine-generating enzyme required for sulfatase activity